jgi:hypothetical protein
MSLPLIIGYHLVWTGYGWWLPNDPRGSMSNCIKHDLLAELGELHFGRKRVQPASREIRTFYEKATPLLQFAQVVFAQGDVDSIASAFACEIERHRYTCYACAKVFMDRPEDIERTARYIEQNPVKIGQPIQRWSFVKKYDRWPLHPGHDPNSPYAIRLRNQ